MGYYTDFTLSLLENPDSISEDRINTEIQRISGYDECEIGCSFNAKWYAHEEHMLFLSKVFPTVVFCLEGYGESADEIWIHYFCNGIDYAEEKAFPPYDPTFGGLRMPSYGKAVSINPTTKGT